MITGRIRIVYPRICADLGGASQVEYANRFTWIHIPGKGIIRKRLSTLRPIAEWSAFYLADACA